MWGSIESFLFPPGEEAAPQHWWRCGRGGRVGRGQCWWNGGRLQADERRCMYPVWSIHLFHHIYIINLPEAGFVYSRWNVYFLFLIGSCVNWAVVIECSPLLPCLCSLCLSPILLSLLIAYVSFFLCGYVFSFPALLSSCLSLLLLLLFNCCLILSKWKVLYKKLILNNFRNLTQSCAILSHPTCESLKC